MPLVQVVPVKCTGLCTNKAFTAAMFCKFITGDFFYLDKVDLRKQTNKQITETYCKKTKQNPVGGPSDKTVWATAIHGVLIAQPAPAVLLILLKRNGLRV